MFEITYVNDPEVKAKMAPNRQYTLRPENISRYELILDMGCHRTRFRWSFLTWAGTHSQGAKYKSSKRGALRAEGLSVHHTRLMDTKEPI